MSTRTARSRRTTRGADRFVPTGSVVKPMPTIHEEPTHSASPSAYEAQLDLLSKELLGYDDSSKMLQFVPAQHGANPRDNPTHSLYEPLGSHWTQCAQQSLVKQRLSHLSTSPYRVLDAIDLAPDFYADLLEWIREDVLLVALGCKMFAFSDTTGSIFRVLDLSAHQTPAASSRISSIKCKLEKPHTAIGCKSGALRIYDLEKQSQVVEHACHAAPLNKIDWKDDNVLTTGARDGYVKQYDLRCATSDGAVAVLPIGNASAYASTEGHCISGLQWSQDRLAVGDDEGFLEIYDARNASRACMTTKGHSTTIKAMAWCPFESNTLATGGGQGDGIIKTWSISSNSIRCTSNTETHSQVCNIAWAPTHSEFVTSHGNGGRSIAVWTYQPRKSAVVQPLSIIKDEHNARVLQLAINPSGSTVVSASDDERLLFWNFFDAKRTGKSSGAAKTGSFSANVIR